MLMWGRQADDAVRKTLALGYQERLCRKTNGILLETISPY